MTSILQGFSYDIFISYRQKDNKYDGWVTEFVDHLKKELEATFKEEISVYFDINPHDGLLETHDVDASLKEKLKCLIFIPIISHTYVDPKSFAWEHEFKAFIEEASKDQFGLKVKLLSGNVANRVLPIRIHDIDPEDLKLLEEYLGFMRPVDFVYHYQGVNRPLRQRDDDVAQSAKQLIYRDQLNKVANAIDEIIRGLNKIQRTDKSSETNVPEPLKEKKDPGRKISKREAIRKKHVSAKLPVLVKWIVVSVVLITFLGLGIGWLRTQKKKEWARLVQIPAIEKMVDENFTVPTRAFDMALELEKIIPGDSSLNKIWSKISTTFPLQTTPEGVKVFWKDYNEPDTSWKLVGETPIENARLPLGFLRMKFEKPGYQTLYYAGPEVYVPLATELGNLKLDSNNRASESMVRIQSKISRMLIVGLEQYGGKTIGEFLVDKYEVSNIEYKKFVDEGGYSNSEYWKYPIYMKGKIISWSEAMKLFVDKTGKPGPSTWEVGSYPEGRDSIPVSGVSWYEAAAYAEFMHKKLPSVYQWSVIAQTGRTKDIIPLSNFNENSVLPVGTTKGITSFGVYDIAGNIREWCLNEGNVPEHHYIMGGGFNDPTYAFNCAYTQLSDDRSVSNGFRCVIQTVTDSTHIKQSGKMDLAFRDYKKEKPVDDKTFDIYRRQFDYDKSDLKAEIRQMENSDVWKVEKVTIDAGYNNERFDIWIFLPKNYPPPYQSVVFFPGSGVIVRDQFSTNDGKRFDFLVKSGRAFIYPVLKSTFERGDGLISDLQEETVSYKDHVIMWRKDIGRTIDYIQEREDLIPDKIGYFGFSWGGFMGGLIPAVENRIQAIVLLVGGMQMNKSMPEVDQINFLPRVHQPVLMLNGKHDMFFPELTSQRPMFDFLGSGNKEMKVYNEGHLVPRQDLVKETLKWYDQYLGEVKK